MRNQIRKDDPKLDLIEHARAVLRGKATLKPSTRMDLIAAVGTPADHTTPDAVIARAYLAALGARP